MDYSGSLVELREMVCLREGAKSGKTDQRGDRRFEGSGVRRDIEIRDGIS